MNNEDIEVALRYAYPRVVARLCGTTGSIDLGEEAAQEAAMRALERWPKDGIPDNPTAWLVRTGSNFRTDQLRHLQMRRNNHLELVNAQLRRFRHTEIPALKHDRYLFSDDLLRLIFACCHPELSADAKVALTLKVVLGFSVDTIAKSLLVSSKAIEKRVTRAKKKLSESTDGYQEPAEHELKDRLVAVRQTIYLVFNSGFDQSFAPKSTGEDLSLVGIRLARMLAELFVADAECQSLLALCLLVHARAPGRVDRRVGRVGDYVPLSEHDRSLWNGALMSEGRALIDAVFSSNAQAGYYQLQAAIASLHGVSRASDTDWEQISGLYQRLMQIDASPVVALNALVAEANKGQLAEAEQRLEQLKRDKRLLSYQPLYAASAFLCECRGDNQGARTAYERAIELAEHDSIQRWLEGKLAQLSSS